MSFQPISAAFSRLAGALARLSHPRRRAVHITPVVVRVRSADTSEWGWSNGNGASSIGTEQREVAPAELQLAAVAHACETLGPIAVYVEDPCPQLREHLGATLLETLPDELTEASVTLCRRLARRAKNRRYQARRRRIAEAEATIATDGSANGEAGLGTWSWYIDEDHWAAGVIAVGRSSTAELEAVAQALEASRAASVVIVTDCLAHLPALRQACALGQTPARIRVPEEVAIWERIVRASRDRTVSAEWVRAHQEPVTSFQVLNRAVDLRSRAALRARLKGSDDIAGPGDYVTIPYHNTCRKKGLHAADPAVQSLAGSPA